MSKEQVIFTAEDYKKHYHNEKDLQNQVEYYLRLKQITYIHLTTFIRRRCRRCRAVMNLAVEGNKNYADLIMFLEGGQTVFMELKSHKGREQKGQKELRKHLTSLGFDCFVVDSFDLFLEIEKAGFKAEGQL